MVISNNLLREIGEATLINVVLLSKVYLTQKFEKYSSKPKTCFY